MEDRNNNGIPDKQELYYLVVRIVVLVWSMGMLSVSYFMKAEIDRTFMATLMTASAASFGVNIKSREREPLPKPPTRRTTK